MAKYRLESGNSAKITWTFKNNEFMINRFVFTLENENLSCVAHVNTRSWGKCNNPKKKIEIQNFSEKTAIEVFNENKQFSTPFYDGVMRVYKDLGLPLGFRTRELKDI